VHGEYARDNAFYLQWDHIARERASFIGWMDEHVMHTRDHSEFMQRLQAA